MHARRNTRGPLLQVPAHLAREAPRRAGSLLRELGAPGVLVLAAFALCGFAAFSSSGIGSIAEGRVHIAVAALLALTGVAWGAGRLHLAPNPLAWGGAAALAALALWMLIGVSGSALPDASWIAANRAAAYAALVAIALLLAGSMRRGPGPHVAVAGLVALCALVALYALAGKVAPGLGFDHTAEFPRLRAPIGYANGLGLLLLLPIGAHLWVASDRRFETALRTGALCALILAIVAAGLTLSRGALLAGAVIALIAIAGGRDPGARVVVAALAVLASIPPLAFGYTADSLNTLFAPLEERTRDGIVLGALLLVSLVGAATVAVSVWRVRWSVRLRLGRRARAAVISLAIAAILGAGVVAAVGRDVQSQVLGAAPEATERAGASRLIAGGDSNRLDWWNEALGGWSARPLAGWGGGSFPVVHRLYRDAVVGVRQPHSVPFQFLVETGVIGFALLLAGLGLLIAAAARRTLAARDAERSARLALLAAAVGWTVHGFVDWDWDLPGVTLPALLALAVAAAPSRGRPPDAEPPPPAQRLGAPAAAALGALVLAVSAGMPMTAEGERREALAIAAGAQGDAAELERAAEHAAMARRLNPLSLEVLHASAEVARFRGAQADYLGFAVEAARRQPLNVAAWLRLLRVQADTGDVRFVTDTLGAIVATDPAFARVALTEGLALVVTPPTLSPTAGGTPLGTVEVPPEEDEEDDAPPEDEEEPAP